MTGHLISYLLYFFIYAFIGWTVEVSVVAVSRHRFANRGVLNLPMCVSYGVIMDLLIMLTGENTEHGFIMFFLSVIVVAAVELIGGELARRLTGRQLWDYMQLSAFGGKWQGSVISLLVAFTFFTFLKLVHPFVYLLVHLMPQWLQQLLCLVLTAMVLLDLLALVHSSLMDRRAALSISRREGKNGTGPAPAGDNRSEGRGLFGWKQVMGTAIYQRIRRRLLNAYPGALRQDDSQRAQLNEEGRPVVFAPGLCFDKLFWIFMLFGLAGNLIETLLVHYQTGIWMRRASLVFVPVSLVWGLGGVLFMIVLSHMARQEDRYIFIGGFFLGGSFEYLCSVFTETFLGTRFWDYTNMPFNLNGRTNLLFMFLWGLVALLWIKILYPLVTKVIEQIPPVLGRAVTMVVVLMVSFDVLLSASVIWRSAGRKEKPEPTNVVEAYLDENYPDEIVKRHWRNIRFGHSTPSSEKQDAAGA